jgi:putative protease
MDKLRLAIAYGADAVYLGGSKFGLRSSATIENEFLPSAIEYAHSMGKRVYVTLNIFARNADFDEIREYAKYLEQIGADAVIVSDLGVLKTVRESTELEIHVSTQANVINKYTAEEYVKLGASRIILARECSLEEVTEIVEHVTPMGCDIEVFVHGAMCVSYSGRCLLSNYMTNRESNRGECAQPCRWEYALVERKRPDESFEIQEDSNGTYIMNSKDLCLIEHLDKVKATGARSFKIEGRMKSEYYVAAVTGAYRRALDGEVFDYMNEVNKIAHRPYTTGFAFGKQKDTEYPKSADPKSTYQVVAQCLGDNNVSQRNVFCVGDTVEILSPHDNHNKTFEITSIIEQAPERATVTRANKANYVYEIDCPFLLKSGDFLRKLVHTS